MSDYKNVNFLVGDKKFNFEVLNPYDDIIIEFLSEFSDILKKYPKVNNYPDLITLSFWCRKKNLQKLKSDFSSPKLKKALGILFHITPSNIPTSFIYSLIFGMITGNSNIVKLPSKEFDQTEIICKILNKILFKKKYKKIKKNLKIVRYSSNEKFTNMVSSIADGRLIWGGDRTIETIKKCNTKNKVTDLIFGDRVSLSVIDLKHLKKINKLELKKLINNFYNDTFLVDQNGCSSPKIIVWLNGNLRKEKEIFWSELNKFVKIKYSSPDNAIFEKYTMFTESLMKLNFISDYKFLNKNLYVISLKKIEKSFSDFNGRWGLFFEYNAKNLSEIIQHVDHRCQTLSYFGLNKNQILNFLKKNNLNGIDRVVKIGHTMDMSFYWDGYDINNQLTRVVDII